MWLFMLVTTAVQSVHLQITYFLLQTVEVWIMALSNMPNYAI